MSAPLAAVLDPPKLHPTQAHRPLNVLNSCLTLFLKRPCETHEQKSSWTTLCFSIWVGGMERGGIVCARERTKRYLSSLAAAVLRRTCRECNVLIAIGMPSPLTRSRRVRCLAAARSIPQRQGQGEAKRVVSTQAHWRGDPAHPGCEIALSLSHAHGALWSRFLINSVRTLSLPPSSTADDGRNGRNAREGRPEQLVWCGVQRESGGWERELATLRSPEGNSVAHCPQLVSFS